MQTFNVVTQPPYQPGEGPQGKHSSTVHALLSAHCASEVQPMHLFTNEHPAVTLQLAW